MTVKITYLAIVIMSHPRHLLGRSEEAMKTSVKVAVILLNAKL
jgi:hypothetical protein